MRTRPSQTSAGIQLTAGHGHAKDRCRLIRNSGADPANFIAMCDRKPRDFLSFLLKRGISPIALSKFHANSTLKLLSSNLRCHAGRDNRLASQHVLASMCLDDGQLESVILLLEHVVVVDERTLTVNAESHLVS